MIQPIPTTYAGINFRSRLEADYAATFTRLGIIWHYEPEGYQLSDGTWYSPDFYLPGSRAWCEVKGDHNERINKLERFAADLWEAAGWPEYDTPEAPMIIKAGSPRKLWGYDTPDFIAVRGIGKAASIGLVRCEECNQVSFIQLWSRLCRACGYWHDYDDDEWAYSARDFFQFPLKHLPRPAGRMS